MTNRSTWLDAMPEAKSGDRMLSAASSGFAKVADMREIGLALRARRKALGLRQEDIAGVAGVGLMFVSSLERGKPTAEIEKVMAVLHAAGIDIYLKTRA